MAEANAQRIRATINSSSSILVATTTIDKPLRRLVRLIGKAWFSKSGARPVASSDPIAGMRGEAPPADGDEERDADAMAAERRVAVDPAPVWGASWVRQHPGPTEC